MMATPDQAFDIAKKSYEDMLSVAKQEYEDAVNTAATFYDRMLLDIARGASR